MIRRWGLGLGEAGVLGPTEFEVAGCLNSTGVS
jgi:hypothetical protein